VPRSIACLLMPLIMQNAPGPIRVDVNLVNVTFTVRDAGGALQPDLKRGDFTLLEDGVPQQIRAFSRESETPLTIGVLLDFSGSQTGLIRRNRATAAAFFRRLLRPEDRAFIGGFEHRINILCDLTGSVDRLEAALGGANDGPPLGPPHRYRGASPVQDAIYYAASDKLKHIGGRKALVLISDGQDTTSHKSVSDVIEMLQSSDVVFYALNPGVGAPVKLLGGPFALLFRSHLARIAEEAGGAEFKLKQVPLEDAFRRIEEELRTTYSIGYVSSRPERDGTFRKIEIRTARPGLVVRARRGYWARDPVAPGPVTGPRAPTAASRPATARPSRTGTARNRNRAATAATNAACRRCAAARRGARLEAGT
jgi:VWFA-related protein